MCGLLPPCHQGAAHCRPVRLLLSVSSLAHLHASSLLQPHQYQDKKVSRVIFTLQEPGVEVYLPYEASFPIPLNYIDVTRATNTSLDVLLEKSIDDFRNVDGDRELSVMWSGSTRFTILDEKPPDGYTWSGERLTRKQMTSRPCEQYTHKYSTYRVAQHDHNSSREHAWLKSCKAQDSTSLCRKKKSHPRVMSHSLPHLTLTTSTSSQFSLSHIPLPSFRRHQHRQDFGYTKNIYPSMVHGRVADQHKSHLP